MADPCDATSASSGLAKVRSATAFGTIFVDPPAPAVVRLMPISLSFVSRAAAAVLDELTDGVAVGSSREIDRSDAFMPVHVECLHQTSIGPLCSVAHYYEQNGDLVPDPDVVFVRAEGGWAPVSFQNALAYRVAVHFHDDGTVEVDEREQRDLVSFCNTWMANIREQQGLPTQKA